MTFKVGEQVQRSDLGLWFGKTSPEPLAATEEKTSQPSLKKRSKSSNRKPPLFLCLTKDGLQQDACLMWTENGALLGEYTMRSFGECPSAENVSRLSAILEECPHPRYCLSAKACQGILNRAERRGKKLPEQLEAALRAQSLFKNEPDAQEGGKGILIQNERTGALSTLNNQSVLAFDTTQITSPLNGNNPKYGDPCHPLAAGMHPPTVVCLNDQGGSIMSVSEDVSGCLRAQEHGHQPICIEMTSTKNTVVEDGVSPTLTARMGTGGNQVNAVLETYQQVTGPLMANSHPGSYCGQDAYSDMLVTTADCRNGYENIELSGTLQAKENGGQSLNYINPVRCGQTVRRLTPLECERLQDYPDGWTDIGDWIDSKGKKHKAADSPRYKAIGNSIALPFWFWLLRRISAQYERPATLGSLFDGIGGFPLCWERCNGKGTALWASEIEEFPMAVTKVRFNDGT